MVSRIFHSLGDQVYEKIKEMIVNNLYLPGETLQIDKLAAEFGVSTTPVREALLRLEGSGLVSIERNKGAVVSTISEETSGYVWQFRRILEAAVAKDAAIGCTKQEIDTMEAELDALDAHPDDFTAYRKTDVAIHELLSRHTKNPLPSTLWTISAFRPTDPARGDFQEEVIREVTNEHREIIAALRTTTRTPWKKRIRHLTNAERTRVARQDEVTCPQIPFGIVPRLHGTYCYPANR